MIRVLFQGDSITDGNRFRDEEMRWDLNHQIGHSYAYIIAAELGKRYPGKYHFINRGVASDCVNRAKLRWQKDTIDEHPDVLSILLGINGNGRRDGVYPMGIEAHLAQFDATYRELLTMSKEANPDIKIVLIEPFCLPVGECKPHYDAFMKVFSRKQRIIEKIADDFDAVFIPTQERLNNLVSESRRIFTDNGCDIDPNAYWVWDGVHPTEAFQGYLAELWLDATKDII